MKKILALVLFLSGISFAQSASEIALSGSLINDARYAFLETKDDGKSYNFDVKLNRKSPFLAGVMSFAIPGAGQIFTENFWEAGVFAAIEISAILIAVSYDKKGDDQTDLYKDYAHKYWSPARYARWTYTNANVLIDKYNSLFGASREQLNLSDYSDLFFDAGRSKVNWSVLNKLEDDISWYYSHKLEEFGEQQYYEMIGKYPQFNVGWEEFGDDENKPYSFGTPVEDQFDYYSKERGKANDFYNKAKWAVVAVVSNHIVSALHAAWSASKFNKKLNFSFSVEEETIGFNKEYYPQLNFNYKL